MPTHVLANRLGATHKGSIGISTATLPDVCKTPSPGGPVPLPYPNCAEHNTLTDGTTTVTIKGNMVAIKGSTYSSSIGDEAGTAGGLTSGTFKKEAEWITYSFDIKMEGANVCRNTDKMFHNHKNTVDLGGNLDPAPIDPWDKEYLCWVMCNCRNAWKDDSPKRDAARLAWQVAPHLKPGSQPKKLELQRCVEKELQNHDRYKPEKRYSQHGKTVIPDVTVVDHLTGKILAFVEMKFPPDMLTKEQEAAQKALANSHGAKWSCLDDERDCNCS